MRPNILFVSLDTVRGDVAYRGTTPGIERLRRQGVTFRQAISSGPLTPVSHATVFTGLQPPNHGIRHLFREQLRADVPTLASLLKEEGYAPARWCPVRASTGGTASTSTTTRSRCCPTAATRWRSAT
jgi:arylsulfatase A-like enzyme